MIVILRLALVTDFMNIELKLGTYKLIKKNGRPPPMAKNKTIINWVISGSVSISDQTKTNIPDAHGAAIIVYTNPITKLDK